jgi:glutathione-independent formaldehyde dehydrogenase
LKIVTTNICGSDQHMVRGRTTAPSGLVLGHEITGQVVECGRDVEFVKEGDICSVPFNIACGRCRNCREGKTGICLNVNPARPGAAYGYVDMGGWVGGQAEYVMVPYADFNLLRFPDRDQAMAKIKDLTLLSDIFPTGYHGAVTAGVRTGHDRLRGRRGSGGPRLRRSVPPAWRGSGDRRRSHSRTACTGAELRL